MTDNSQNKIAEAFAIAFNTPTGIEVLDHLHLRYYDIDSFDKDPYVHARNAGRRDVVRYIMLMRDRPAREHELAKPKQELGDNENE